MASSTHNGNDINTNNIIGLLQKLISYSSESPDNSGCLQYIANILQAMGMRTIIKHFHKPGSRYGVDNLYAYSGELSNDSQPNVCFVGHSDVVPAGDHGMWSTKNPYDCQIDDNGVMIGRGCVDMKGAIACFITALANNMEQIKTGKQRISLLITADEEADGVNGTQPMIEYLVNEEQECFSLFLIGEPTAQKYPGDTIKIGRRGSLSIDLQVIGKQGHVAYPDKACNSVTIMIKILNDLQNHVLDDGDEYFQPSNLEVTSVDVNNKATNVIAHMASAKINIRFNTLHTTDSLLQWVDETCNRYSGHNDCHVVINHSCNCWPFITPVVNTKAPLDAQRIATIIQSVNDMACKITTDGGTSDGRFLYKYACVVELGLCNDSAHHVDEQVPVAHLTALCRLYDRIINNDH